MKIEIPKARSTVTDGPDGLKISIPAKRNAFAIAFLTFWLVGWGFAEVTTLGRLAIAIMDGEFPGPDHLFLVAWVGGWTVVGAVAIATWAWMLRGRECIVLQAAQLVVRRDVFGLGCAREYDLQHVSNLRITPPTLNPSNPLSAMQFWGMGGGGIAFDYGPRTIRFGASIDEAEGKDIVEHLRSRHRFGGIVGA